MNTGPLHVGSNRQLFLDERWFDSQDNVRLEMHAPVVRDVALKADRPWENGGINLPNVVRDGGRYRMWYRSDAGDPNNDSAAFSCYAESDDGIHWTKPDLASSSFRAPNTTTSTIPRRASKPSTRR